MSNPLFAKNKHRIGNQFNLLLAFTALAAVLLAACSAQGSATTAPASPSVVVATATVATPPTSAPSATAAVATEASSTAGQVSFSKDVQPLLQSRCAGCHGSGRAQGGLNVSSYDSLMAGSRNGAVIVPGDAGNSRLVQLVQEGKMPKSGPKLTSDQVQLLVDWVKAGALNN